MAAVYLDTETTGLHDAGIVEIAIVADDDSVLLESLVNPGKRIEFDAEWIHGIDDEMVADAPRLEDLEDRIDEILSSADEIVIYNAEFDWPLMPEVMRTTHGHKVRCCMLRYAEWNNDWNPRYGDYRWVKLSEAASVAGFDWSGLKSHRAASDALACGHVWRHMNANDKRDRSVEAAPEDVELPAFLLRRG